MLTIRQLRKLKEAGLEINNRKRASNKKWHGEFRWNETKNIIEIRLYPYKSCTWMCNHFTLLHELIHARDYLRGKLLFIGEAKAHEITRQDIRTDMEAVKTFAHNPKIFEEIENLWGIAWEETK